MCRSIGIIIPEGCKQIYIFENEEDFIKAIESGKMTPLYGANSREISLFPVYIAYRILK